MRYAVYHKDARKVLRKMPKNIRETIIKKVDSLVNQPETLTNNITKLQNDPYHRLRVGNWRIKYMDNDPIIDIIDIFSRSTNYKP